MLLTLFVVKVVPEVALEPIVITGPEKYVGGYRLSSTPLDVTVMFTPSTFGTM
jgi:hypothetical protein